MERAHKYGFGIRDPRHLSPPTLIKLLAAFVILWGSVVFTQRTSYPDLTWLRMAITGLILVGALIMPRSPRDCKPSMLPTRRYGAPTGSMRRR